MTNGEAGEGDGLGDPGRDGSTAREYAARVGLWSVLEEASIEQVLGDPESDPDFLPDIRDLARLHHLVRTRRVVTVLEFGCGWSTLAMAHALSMNEDEYGDVCSTELRRSNPFELHFVDDIAQFIQAAVARIPKRLRRHVFPSESAVEMTTFAGRICTEYEQLPNVCPDLIYLDAPSLLAIRGDVNGIGMDNPDRVPMSCDILKVEHFLLPGTILVVDGRTANARFLRCNLQRSWRYVHDPDGDVSAFELLEPPLGPFNRQQIEFCLGADWLDQLEGERGLSRL